VARESTSSCVWGFLSGVPAQGHWAGLLALALLAASPHGAFSERRAPARVTASSLSNVVFRVDVGPYEIAPSAALEGTERCRIDGFSGRGQPGEPARPVRKFLVGLPPAGNWSLSWRVLDSVPLGRRRLEPMPFAETERAGDLGLVATERWRMEPSIYDAYRGGPAVTAGSPAWIRRQRVLPVYVEPLAYDAATGEASLATSIEVTVSFDGGSRLDGSARPSDNREWEETFARLVVNAGQARAWRASPRVREQSPVSLEGLMQPAALVKLKVRETGIHAVTAATLAAAGFPAAQPVSSLHLFRRDYDGNTFQATATDVACSVREGTGGTPGVFDGQDLLVFYGQRLRDDPSRGDTIEQFSDHNVYWLGTSGGPAMDRRALSPGFLSADTASVSFPISEHFEADHFFREETPVGLRDFYYYNWGYETSVEQSFEVGAVRSGSTLTLDAELHGVTLGQIRTLRIELVNSKGTTVLNPGFAVAGRAVVHFRPNIAATSLDVGPNKFRFARTDGGMVQVLLNWLQADYQSLFRARGNALRFNTGSLSGDTSITVTGFSTTDLWLFDVTNPLSPVLCDLEPSLFRNVGNSYALTFRDAIASRKQYILVPESRMVALGSADVVLDSPSALIGSWAESGVDVLVVAHGDFVAGMADWVRFRRAQGYRVLLADVQDVYDEFHGGIPGTLGIDRFVRHFFEFGNAGYVLLVGDSNEDNKQVHEDSPPSYVPSHARAEHVGSPFDDDEVVTVDKLYVKLPGPGGIVDDYPDLAIGRIPAGSDNELQMVLYKIFQYEKPQASDFWRRRMIIVADDAWSAGGSVFGGAGTRYYPGELYFENGQEETARTIESAHPGGYEIVRFYLADYTDAIHPTHEDDVMYKSQQYTRANATPVLMNELNRGATLVTIQAHMNRSLVTHEWLLTTIGSAVPPPNRDHLRLDNRDKPFIIFGMGCHFSDYALNRELTRLTSNSPNGDAFAEQLLFQNRKAAVGTYGSSGFEYLSQTNDFMTLMSQLWFYEAPYESMVNQTQGHWIFGQLMFLIETQVVGVQGQDEPVERYHILGDPLLRIDAGPPLMEVTVDGVPVESGAAVSAMGGADSIRVVARVSDENVIEKFELLIDGADASGTMVVTPIGDGSIPFSRTYDVRFSHRLEFKNENYDIVLRALQAPDTTAGSYYMAAEFVLYVESAVRVTVNGRLIASGDPVPARGDYRIELGLPVYVPASEISVAIDGEVVSDLTLAHPSEQDTTTWIARFSRALSGGSHRMIVTAGTVEFPFDLVVSSTVGLRDVVNYPNPFRDGTRFVYTNEVEIDEGTIDVFTTSGKRIARLDVPPNARAPGQNAVFWDGRDAAGDEIANGVYLYVIRVKQRGEKNVVRGTLARIE